MYSIAYILYESLKKINKIAEFLFKNCMILIKISLLKQNINLISTCKKKTPTVNKMKILIK